MTPMISTGLHRYAGKDLSPGDRFEADDAHVRTLVLSRKAKLAGENQQTYDTRALEAGVRRHNNRKVTKA